MTNHEATAVVEPRHDLSDEELNNVHQMLKTRIEDQFGVEENVYAAWLGNQTAEANAVRTLEARQWSVMPEVMEPHEKSSLFLAVFDTRKGEDRIVHAFRVSGAGFDSTGDGVVVSEKSEEATESTGIVLIDDVVASEQGFTTEDFKDYYLGKGMDLNKCVSVETNFRVGNKVERYNGLPLTQIGYIALFKLVEDMGIESGEAAVFAALNSEATVSLGLIGAEFEPLAGRDDLRTPSTDDEGNPCFDDDYKLVCITATPNNLEVFRSLATLAAPQLYVD